MAFQENITESKQEELRSVVLLRHPAFSLSSREKHHLHAHFHVLDPSLESPDEPIHSYLSRHAQLVRVLLCAGPCPVTGEILGFLPSLELIVCSSAGLNHLDLLECRRRGITVTNASTAFAEDVAEHVIALLLDVLRGISTGDRYIRAGLWTQRKADFPLGFKLGGKRVGIVGLGRIGSAVARRLEPFGCTIAYTSRNQKPSVPFPYYTNVHDLATNSDILILCCALTEETRHMITKQVLSAMGKQGVIINVGRGALIDEKELIECLVQREIGGAGLDVFENEPNVSNQLYGLDNVVLSPHRAGMSHESFAALYELILANLNAFFLNRPLRSVVHLD